MISVGAFSNVSVIITDHFVEEGLGLISAGNFHARSFDDVDNFETLVIELLLDLLLVLGESVLELLILWVLLDGTNGPNGSSLRSNLVLESNGKQVSLLGGKVVRLRSNDLLKIGNHVIKPFGLLSDSCHKNMLFKTHLFRLAYTKNIIKKFESQGS